MLDSKTPLQSLTINASLVALIVQILALFGIQIAPEVAADIGASVNSIITVATLLLAIYGRLKASKRIEVAAPDKVACAPVAVGMTLLVALLLSACATTGTGTATPTTPAPGSVRLTIDRALSLAEVVSAGIDASTASAIDAGRLTGTAAIEARERADRVRTAMLLARGAAFLWGARQAEDRAAVVLELASVAQSFLPAPAAQ